MIFNITVSLLVSFSVEGFNTYPLVLFVSKQGLVEVYES